MFFVKCGGGMNGKHGFLFLLALIDWKGIKTWGDEIDVFLWVVGVFVDVFVDGCWTRNGKLMFSVKGKEMGWLG